MDWRPQQSEPFTIDDLESYARRDPQGYADLHLSVGTVTCRVVRDANGTITRMTYTVDDRRRAVTVSRSQAIAMLAHLYARMRTP